MIELITIIIGVTIFLLSYNSKRFAKNDFFVFIGIVYLNIGIIDLIHTLTYEGTKIVNLSGANIATQLWVASRLIQSISVLIAPLFFKRKLKFELVFLFYGLITGIFLASIFYFKTFPVMYIIGSGLTEIKKISELLISFVFLLAIFHLNLNRKNLDNKLFLLLIISFFINIFTEIIFIGYFAVDDFFNYFGHVLKFVSYFIVYKALVETGLMEPYRVLFADLEKREKEVKLQRDKLRKYLDVAGVIFLALNRDGKVTMINNKGSKILNCKRSEIIGKNWFDNFIPSEIRDEMKEVFYKVFEGKIDNNLEYYENEILTCDKKVRLCAWHNSFIKNEKGEIISLISSGEDITQERMTDDKVKESEMKLRTITETANDGIILVDGRGKIIYWNRGAENIFGYKELEVIGKLFPFLLKEGVDLDKIYQTEYGALSVFEVEALRKDKSSFPAELSLSHWKLRHSNYYTMVIRDITDRKELEKRKDMFLSFASHELKTPLTSIRGFSQLLMRKMKQNKEKENYYFAEKIDKSVGKLADLINELLEMGRIQAGQLRINKKETDINELVDRVISDFIIGHTSHNFVKKGEVKNMIMIDDHRVEQVLLNLFSNAVKYSPQADKVIVKLEESKQEVIISVEDFGIGISNEDKDKVFNRFYRSSDLGKQEIKGFGIGLFISLEIVRAHGGEIWIDRKEKGSIFKFNLPKK